MDMQMTDLLDQVPLNDDIKEAILTLANPMVRSCMK